MTKNIVPESKNLESILNGVDRKYFVPDYQRDYSWSVNEVEILWQDIISSYEQQTEYFMGTVVLKKQEDHEEHYDIVDGQQRLATFSLLFSAVAEISSQFDTNFDIFKDVPRSTDNIKLARKISSRALSRLKDQSEPENLFLKLNKKDNELFSNILNACDDLVTKIHPCDGNITYPKNERKLKKNKIEFSNLIFTKFSGITALQNLHDFMTHTFKKLMFITIAVKTDYDAFLLFESLNSKGMDLSVSDLIKNKVLMKAGGNENINEEILSNWEQLIESIDETRLSPVEFIRIYWESIRGTNTTKKTLYKQVSSYIDSNHNSALNLTKDLRDLSENFSEYASSTLIFPECLHKKSLFLKSCGEINTLKYTTCYPVIMYARQYSPESTYENIAKLSLSFLFRWITICDLSIGGAKKVFDKVLKNLKEGKIGEDLYQPFFNETDKIGNQAFKKAFRQFRTQDNQIAKYILSKNFLFENQLEYIPNYSQIHLEHVFPQQSSKWIDNIDIVLPLGLNEKDVTYNLGNMVLLNKSLNQKIKNDTFDKKVIHYSESPFPDTKGIFDRYTNDEKEWSYDWINERLNILTEKAPKIWPLAI
ncbi:DUF262 domain-containing HNH endonuclease family protein [Enterobacter sp. MYb186]